MWWHRRSFEVLPALRIGGKPLRRNLHLVTVARMLGVVWMNCVAGSQMNQFCELLGFTNRDFGYLSAIIWAAYLAQLISAMLIERTGLRRLPFILFASISRLSWIVLAAVPFFLGSGRAAIRAFLIIYAVGAVMTHMSMSPWWNWMGDMIPRRIRGRYWANRRLLTAPIGIAVTVAAGLLLDHVTVKGQPVTMAAQPYLMGTIAGLLVVGAIFGTLDVLVFLKMREIVSPPLLARGARPKRRPLVAAGRAVIEPFQAVVEAVRDPGFAYYGLFTLTLAFAMTVGSQFWWRNCLQNLQYSRLGANIIFMACSPISALVFVRLWGRLIDRWGRRPVLMLTLAGVVLSPLPWFFVPEGAAWGEVIGWSWLPAGMTYRLAIAYGLGAAACLFGGAMWSGVEMGRLGIILGFSDGRGRSKYVAAAGVFSAVGGVLGGLTGGWLADFLIDLQYDRWPVRVGPFLWNNWHMTFLLSALARALAFLWVVRMPDPGSKRFRDVVRHIGGSIYNNALPRLFRRPLWFRRRRSSNVRRLRVSIRRLLRRRRRPAA